MEFHPNCLRAPVVSISAKDYEVKIGEIKFSQVKNGSRLKEIQNYHVKIAD